MRYIILSLLLITNIMGYSQQKINLTANGKTVSVTLTSNNATSELLTILPVTIEMSPYGGFEVVGPLPQSLPTSNSQITTQPGDIMLYQGSQLVIFYGSNSWSYTPIGKIDNATAQSVKELLGSGNVSVTLTSESSDIKEIDIDEANAESIYNLAGYKVDNTEIKPGFYIINGKKTLIK